MTNKPRATVIVDRDFTVGETDPRLFGGFIEHLGRHIYTGIYEPGHPRADADGFREDVLELVRELNMPIMRYPGGNFVSGYHWEDGVGPRDQRPVRLDFAWQVTETNQFGTNEFITWCRKAGTAPMLAVNLGTRGPAEAREYLEYCNHAGGTAWSDLRRRHGYPEPHNVRLWCLGNEMDGPWQLGHMTAEEYGRLAAETARIMKQFDPNLELVVCGSSHRGMPTFGTWEWTVLDHAFEHVDYLSLHTYYGRGSEGTPGYLGWPDHMDRFIEEAAACADAVAAKRRSPRRIHLSFDEWNVWGNSGSHRLTEPWPVAPRSHESIYTVEDALVVGGMLLALLNHADRVRVGCLAQVVNVIAPIMTEPGGAAWRQTIFYPFAQASRYGRGVVLRTLVTSTAYDAPNGHGFPHLKTAVVRSPEGDALTIFALNRAVEQSLALTVEMRAFAPMRVAEWTVLRDDDLTAANTRANPARVQLRPMTGATMDGSRLMVRLPPASWNMIRLASVQSIL